MFHKSSVRQAILENASQVVNKRHKKLVCPSATRWLDHERAFSRVIESYEETIIALSTVWTERGDPEAFGILIQMTRTLFEQFKTDTQIPFVEIFCNEVCLKIKPSPVSSAFTCLNSKYVPEIEIEDFGTDDLVTLGKHYGESKEAVHPTT